MTVIKNLKKQKKKQYDKEGKLIKEVKPKKVRRSEEYYQGLVLSALVLNKQLTGSDGIYLKNLKQLLTLYHVLVPGVLDFTYEKRGLLVAVDELEFYGKLKVLTDISNGSKSIVLAETTLDGLDFPVTTTNLKRILLLRNLKLANYAKELEAIDFKEDVLELHRMGILTVLTNKEGSFSNVIFNSDFLDALDKLIAAEFISDLGAGKFNETVNQQGGVK